MVDVNEKVSKTVDEVNELAGKYLTFRLDREEYGLEILKVREIIGLMDITSVPRTPTSVRGVINLRGKVIPVIDLRVKFGMETIRDSEQTCIIVVEVMKGDRAVEMGILVDAVSEVLDISAEDIEEAPSFGQSFETDFILGMAKTNDRVTILLNIHKVVTADEVVSGLSSSKGQKDINENDSNEIPEEETKDDNNKEEKEINQEEDEEATDQQKQEELSEAVT